LAQIFIVDIRADNRSSSFSQLKGVEAGVTADIQRLPASQIFGQIRRNLSPLKGWKIS
jgi:hypothetical protein